MNVGELRKVLEDFDDATEIIIAKHGPANSDDCSPLDEIDASFYRPRNKPRRNARDP